MISTSTPRRRGRGVFLLGALLCGFLAPTFHPALAQEETAGFSGLVLDPDGKPAEGFQLVFRDDAAQEHVAPPSDDLGRYSIDLVPGSYQLVAAIAPDGSRLDVPALPSLPVEWGARRLDVRIGRPEQPAGKGAGKAASKPAKTQAGSGVPWVQIGAAAGTVLILALAVWSGDDAEKTASPFVPPPGP